MKWVTRENAKVDRIACPWLIHKFVDSQAEFLFVPKEQVMKVAKSESATPFDLPGAELFHFKEGNTEYVTFDAIIKKFKLTDQALLELAKIVRGADARIPNEAPESAGLEAAAIGFNSLAGDDFVNMKMQFPFYDALYAYCQLKISGQAKLEHSGR